MGKRAIIFFWLLLLIPTLLIAAGAIRLLRHEQARFESLRVTAARETGGALADSLQITISEIEAELLTSLRAVPQERLVETLGSWEAENYLVRNVFVWDPDRGLLVPRPGAGTTNEERSFIGRYEALFSGRYGWFVASEGEAGVAPAKPPGAFAVPKTRAQSDHNQKPSPLVKSIEKLKASRRRMVQAAKSAPPPDRVAEALPAREPARGGWIPWFEENRLHILGWVQKSQKGPVYGLELELMALLSRLVPEFASLSEPGTVYALIDGSGRILSQSNGVPLAPGDKPDISVSLLPHLPHWQVAVFFSGSPAAGASGSSLFLLTSLLLGIFIAAILSGGGLLTWQALRNLKDARQKTSFVSNVSHELKTPLTSIMMYAELLMEGRVANSAKKDHYLKVIVDESRRLTRLVNNVLDFSRLEQGRKTYNHRKVDLGRYLVDLLERHQVHLQEASMEIDLQAESGRFFSKIDRDALDQVMMNLIDNAIKYADEGGYIGLHLYTEKEMHSLRVEDRGPGIPETFTKRLFEKFQRADDSLTTSKPGSGLGLSIARQLIRDQGGDLRFEPIAGGGSCFIILLPAEEKSDDN
ncbi:MAG: HAMP domain-containing histidine kinase [Desulfobacterales bacterium]|nr:HAMP domain-containing histidine kinase [Desulfobacterales bacterium]